MKLSVCLLFSIFGLGLHAQNDLLLHINDSVIEIASDRVYTIPVNGELVEIKVVSKDTQTYEGDLVSFAHSKDFMVSELNLGEGIEQRMIMNAEGTGFVIQEYSALNPTLLNEILLNEVTKESVDYGFSMKREDYTRQLASGETVEVSKAILTYKDETNIYEVASVGQKDEGILIMTMRMDKEENVDNALIDLMWDSVRYLRE